jgi:hypothetical protein
MRVAHTQDCTAQTANVEASVIYRTLSFEGNVADAQRAAIGDAVRREGGAVVWRASEPAGRSYALLELPDGRETDAIRAASGATAYDRAVIALAVFPAMAQALPPLREALGGHGRPQGVLACRPCSGGIVVEWDPERTRASVILGLIDVELRRFGSGRVAEVLSPLPAPLVAKVAAEGLEAPEIEPRRILELRIDRA